MSLVLCVFVPSCNSFSHSIFSSMSYFTLEKCIFGEINFNKMKNHTLRGGVVRSNNEPSFPSTKWIRIRRINSSCCLFHWNVSILSCSYYIDHCSSLWKERDARYWYNTIYFAHLFCRGFTFYYLFKFFEFNFVLLVPSGSA